MPRGESIAIGLADDSMSDDDSEKCWEVEQELNCLAKSAVSIRIFYALSWYHKSRMVSVFLHSGMLRPAPLPPIARSVTRDVLRAFLEYTG